MGFSIRLQSPPKDRKREILRSVPRDPYSHEPEGSHQASQAREEKKDIQRGKNPAEPAAGTKHSKTARNRKASTNKNPGPYLRVRKQPRL